MTQPSPPTTFTAQEIEAIIAMLDRVAGTRMIVNILLAKQNQSIQQHAAAKKVFDHEAAANAVVPTEPKVEPEVASAKNRAERRAAAKNGKAAS